MGQFTGKIVLITGSISDIGRVIANRLSVVPIAVSANKTPEQALNDGTENKRTTRHDERFGAKFKQLD